MIEKKKEQAKAKSGAEAFLQDLVCGSFAGFNVCISGHPLDSMKVRMQNSAKKVTFVEICKKTYKHEGFFGFYKGMGPPLVNVPLVNSIVFSAYEFCKRLMGVVSEDDFTFN